MGGGGGSTKGASYKLPLVANALEIKYLVSSVLSNKSLSMLSLFTKSKIYKNIVVIAAYFQSITYYLPSHVYMMYYQPIG